MGAVHAALTVVTLLVGNRSLHLTIYANNLEFARRNATVDPTGPAFTLTPTPVPFAHLPLTWLTAAFFACSAIAHLGNATLWRAFYERELCRCRVPTRWIEYFVSAPIMFLLIAVGVGIRDYTLLIALAGLIATTMPFGHWCETIADPRSPDAWGAPLRTRLLPYAIGHVPQLTAWAVVLLNFYDESGYSDRAPWFVPLVLWLELALFGSFGAVLLWQQCQHPVLYYRGELAYQALSLASKAVLGGLMLANVLVLGSYDDIFA